jgi:hypothetical protein
MRDRSTPNPQMVRCSNRFKQLMRIAVAGDRAMSSFGPDPFACCIRDLEESACQRSSTSSF